MDFSPSAPRKRGAQPGNANARKHGFYSSRLLPDEVKDLDDLEPVDMSGEIDLIRTQLRRLLEDANAQPASFQQRIDLIRVICIAVRSLSRLIRTHNTIYPKGETRIAELRLMADEIREDLERHARRGDPNALPVIPAASHRYDSPPPNPDDPDDPDADDPYIRDMLTNPAFVHPMDVQDD